MVKPVKPFKGEFELAQMVKFEFKNKNCTMYIGMLIIVSNKKMTMTDNMKIIKDK